MIISHIGRAYSIAHDHDVYVVYAYACHYNKYILTVMEFKKCLKPDRPSKHKTLSQCWIDVGPPSATLDQH